MMDRGREGWDSGAEGVKNLKISFWPRGQHLEAEGAKPEGVFPVNQLRPDRPDPVYLDLQFTPNP